jgi:hypothetical protein
MLETMQRARDYPRSRVAVAYCASRGLRSSARRRVGVGTQRNGLRSRERCGIVRMTACAGHAIQPSTTARPWRTRTQRRERRPARFGASTAINEPQPAPRSNG